MANAALDTSLVDRAITFAVRAHAGTRRRGKEFPYIVHPLEALAIVATMTSDPEILAAAVLHDTVEDTGTGVEELRREFGARVASLVAAETDTISDGSQAAEGSWMERKRRALDRLAKAPLDVKMVALGDKLSNMRAIARDFEAQGDSFWNLFHEKDPKVHAWRYRALADALKELSGTLAFREFEDLINRVFDGRD